jgi:glycogen synthase
VTVHRVAAPSAAHVARDGFVAFLHWVDELGARLEATAVAVHEAGAVDVVHAHEWHAGAAAIRVAARCGRPLVATVHATTRAKVRARGAGSRPTVEAAERELAAAARVVTVASRWLAGELAALGLPRDRVRVLPLGIEPAPAPSAADLLRAGAELDAAGRPALLAAGRFVAEKGFQDAIAALPAVRERHPGAALAIAGRGRLEGALRDVAARAGVADHVRFLGHLSQGELAAWYPAADLVVIPSRYEPFGLVALEAMAAGRPVLGADVGGLAEILLPGEPGLRFGAGDVAALAARASALLADDAERDRLAEAGCHRARGFGADRAAAGFAQLYAGVLDGEGSALAVPR